MRQWIDALLDPLPIEKGNKDKHTTNIRMPPRFDPSKIPSASFPAQAPSLRSTRARSTRSASPSKMATPRKIATPRKPRTRKAEQIVQTEEMEVTETTTAVAPETVLENGTAEVATPDLVNGEAKDPDTVRIEVSETIETVGDIETKTTNVKVDVPADHPELREPEDPKALMEEAQRMVAEAKKIDGGESSKGKSKRKAEELGADEVSERPQRPAKLARTQSTLEQKLAKEKVTRRALVGVTVMAAITYVSTTCVARDTANNPQHRGQLLRRLRSVRALTSTMQGLSPRGTHRAFQLSHFQFRYHAFLISFHVQAWGSL